MSDENESNSLLSRRTFNKGAVASGAAALGIAGVGGSAAAQNVRNLQLNVVNVADSLLEIEIRNVNVLNNINVEDVVVTVIGGDLRILEEGININDSLIEINNNEILNDSLNNNDVQVAVAVLGEADNVLASGDTIA